MVQTRVLMEELDGVELWIWPANDLQNGLWDGPSKEWPVFKEWILKHIPTRRVCIQAGGAAGVYPRLLSPLFEQVHTFEPDKINFHCLIQNCRGVDNVSSYNAALGNYCGEVQIDRHLKCAGMHKITSEYMGPGCAVHQLALDVLGFNRVDLIMLDVEHYEHMALKGAWNLIANWHPVIQVENGDSLPVLKLMSDFDYVKIESHNQDSLWKHK